MILKTEMLLEFQNKTDIEITAFRLMNFELDASDIDLRDKDLLDTDISNKDFVSLQEILKTSSGHAFKTSLA